MLVLKRKQFSSKAQKALRAKYELEKFNQLARPELIDAWSVANKKQVIRKLDKTPILTEKVDRGISITKSDLLNSSINNKAKVSGSLASGIRVEHGEIYPKKLLKGYTYDHTKVGAESIAKNKDMMKSFKTRDQLRSLQK